MIVVLTQNIMFEREIHDAGTELDVSQEQADELVAQGVAEIQETKKSHSKQEDSQNPPASQPEDFNFDRSNRSKLEEYAQSIGFDQDTVAFEKKADLIQAIKEFQASPVEPEADVTEESEPTA